MKYLFIMNPNAGKGKAEELITKAISSLPMREDCILYETLGPKDAVTYVRDWCKEHTGEEARFIACGGDGTLNEVINGIMFSGREDVSVTCFPCGSGNDFVKIFGDKEKLLDIEKLLTAPTMKMDIIKVTNLSEPDLEFGEEVSENPGRGPIDERVRYCDNIINFGFDTEVLKKVIALRKKIGRGGPALYLAGVIHALHRAMRNHFKVYADGDLLNPNGEALLCDLANGQYVGGSFRCTPKAEIDDGLMDVVLVEPVTKPTFVKFVKPYAKGEHLDRDDIMSFITYRKAKSVRIEADPGFAYSLDGELIFACEFECEVVPGAINFAVPDNRYSLR